MPGSKDWDLVESLMALHDREFNDRWIRSWTTRQMASVKLEKIREQVCLIIEEISSLRANLDISLEILLRSISPSSHPMLVPWCFHLF